MFKKILLAIVLIIAVLVAIIFIKNIPVKPENIKDHNTKKAVLLFEQCILNKEPQDIINISNNNLETMNILKDHIEHVSSYFDKQSIIESFNKIHILKESPNSFSLKIAYKKNGKDISFFRIVFAKEPNKDSFYLKNIFFMD